MHLFIRQHLNHSVTLRSLSLMLCTALSLGCASTKDDTSQAAASDASDASSSVDASEPTGPDSTRSPARVFLCADADLPTSVLEAFAAAEFTRCAMPFGIVLAADDRMPEAYVQKTAQILAELMDKNMDGIADDEALASQLSQWSTAWLAMPWDPERWENVQLPRLQRALGYDIVIPRWWMENSSLPDPGVQERAMMVEEIVHFMTQFGWSELYPVQFGVNDWSSVIAKEMQAAACDWWQHPENDCPGSPAQYPGDCSDPSCDIVEFYQQVLVLRAGMTPGWFGIGFPRDSESLEAKLSQELKDIMDDPQYHQPTQPLEMNYPL